MSGNPYSAPAANLDHELVPHPDDPPDLWNPAATVVWGFFLSPVFGGILQMRNWQALGKPDEAIKSKQWVVATVLFAVIFVLVDMLPPVQANPVASVATKLMGAVWFIVWYVASGRKQSRYVLSSLRSGYFKRGWFKPLVIAIGCYLLIVTALGLVYAAMIGAGVVATPAIS